MYRARQESQATAIILLHTFSFLTLKKRGNLDIAVSLPVPLSRRQATKMPSLDATTIAATTSLCVIPLLVTAILLLAINLVHPRTQSKLEIVQPQLQSPLLALPFELRTQIWLLTIPYEVTLTKQEPLPRIPAAGFACRQILREITPLFRLNTKSLFYIEDCDGAFTCAGLARLRQLKESARSEARGAKVGVRFRGGKKWSNVMIWAEEVHSGGLWFSLLVGAGPNEALVANTMAITQRLKPLPWSEAKEILELLPLASDPAWA